ncbi:MAG: phosphate acyltransferase PlsX [Oscillospiraceae bacterium]|nr:phosphate acyltransferase PlsX [Oscillospiraceae bacterium]
MKIIVDAFGGDNAPLAVLEGCRQALDAEGQGLTIVLTGPQEAIEACAAEHKISLAGMEIRPAPRIFEMEMEPHTILRENSDTSLGVGLKALAAGEGDAFVSAGSTGALMVGATLFVKRIRGVRRAAIGTVLPSDQGPFLLLDAGANAECTAEMLENFAVLGDAYMRKVLGVAEPKVGLANIGTESTKGDTLRQEAYQRLQALPGIRFTGNIEAREVPKGECQVVVTDGFTGNIMLKLFEGVAGTLLEMLKDVFKKNPLTMLGAVLVSKGLLGLKKKMDYAEYGGAPLLGIDGVVIKAHGSANAKAFRFAIRQARRCLENHMVQTIKENLTA